MGGGPGPFAISGLSDLEKLEHPILRTFGLRKIRTSSLQHATEMRVVAHRGKEDYWLWDHLMRISWLWDHLMRISWLWDHLMRPTLRARGEIELPSTPGKRSVERRDRDSLSFPLSTPAWNASAAHFSTIRSGPYQIGAINIQQHSSAARPPQSESVRGPTAGEQRPFSSHS
ncbi:unnamed protein product [Gadus morhua 'NCC']